MSYLEIGGTGRAGWVGGQAGQQAGIFKVWLGLGTQRDRGERQRDIEKRDIEKDLTIKILSKAGQPNQFKTKLTLRSKEFMSVFC